MNARYLRLDARWVRRTRDCANPTHIIWDRQPKQ